ncbi:hypothetical protein GCM10023205_40580 [Yinghuangia aomiensis]|uniref:Uncharacterized protein n=1 Tax=Yinghuangia aomiensis TaxID=676205 RepID=A0ABP9HH38_9ACTN
MTRMFVGSMDGGGHEIAIRETPAKVPASGGVPEPLVFEVGAWVVAAPGYTHRPGVVVEIVRPVGTNFRVAKCEEHGSRMPYLAVEHELTVVPRGGRESTPGRDANPPDAVRSPDNRGGRPAGQGA